MDKKEKSEKVLNIIKDYKNSSNKDLILAMDHLQEDFEFTKNMVLKGSEQIDKIETIFLQFCKSAYLSC